MNFKDIARRKQVDFFEKHYKITEFATIKRKPITCTEPKDFYVQALLKWEDAQDGKIFYEGYRSEILNDIPRLRKSGEYTPSGMMLCHTLRSEHIPWNIFFPMSLNDEMKKCAMSVFNSIIEKVSSILPKIKKITDIRIEYAPKDKEATKKPFTRCFLNDKTSFDTYIVYLAEDGKMGGIGIEVKYTEEGYRPSKTEMKAAITEHENPQYRYWDVMKKSGYYISEAYKPDNNYPTLWSPLVSDELRQIWRNHLLGASMVQHNDITHFLSLHLYPQGNTHFHGDSKHAGAVSDYKRWLTEEGQQTWTALTFEDLFQLMQDSFTGHKDKLWINYLKERYLF